MEAKTNPIDIPWKIAILAIAVSSVSAEARPFPICEGQSGKALKICEKAVASECGRVPTERLSPCKKIEAKFRTVTKNMPPPWLGVADTDDSAQFTPVNLSVPRLPQPVLGSDQMVHLVYELQIQNFGSYGKKPAPPPPATLVVEEASVYGDQNAKPILSLSGEPLAERMQSLHLGAPFPGGPAPFEIQPAQSAILFLDIPFESMSAVPKTLTHRVTVSAVPGTGPEPIVQVARNTIDVNPAPVLVVGPFLRGGGWAMSNGCCDFLNSAHRRVVRSIDGAQYFPERYAMDMVKINKEFRLYSGSGDKVEDWFGTGAEVLSVADGVVTRVVVGQKNNPIGEYPFPPVIATGGGNEVLVRIGENIYAMYGHLLPGSVKVRVGDRVSRGEALGSLGNTGISGAPHLHFQIMDANSIGKSHGLPFVFDEFELLATFADMNLDTGGFIGLKVLSYPERREQQMPLQNTIIRFPR
jgi:Peptidase family M23